MSMIKRVENDLKPHNVETIKRILEFYKQSNKCCAIQATGTGKTFLILRLLEIFNDKDKKAVIFAPNREIIKQTKRRMKKFGLDNAVFYTYQKLAKMTNDEIKSINADLIVCDELHRTGAKTWGAKFEVLVETHPQAKVFGVTATPLRCADGRDMAEEYFDNNKACDISLAEALVREIIPVMPLYVSGLFTFEEEYENMREKIKKSNNSNEEKAELQEVLFAAKQQMEKAKGVPQIIKKYITNYNGKYIVFCKDKTHLYAMKDVVVGWFREAGYTGEVFEYPYYSNSSEVKKNLDNFEANKKEGLKLLFVIDKLNEGLHLDEIHGCILLRTTTSNIIYYQQIGRAIDAGSNEQRVILDLVSNFNSLKSFNFKKELENKVVERREGKFAECYEEFEIDKFDVVDLVQECVDVFSKIDAKIKSPYDNFKSEEWNDTELKIVLDNYTKGKDAIMPLLPNRSWHAIKGAARKLGIKISDCNHWTETEEKEFIRLFEQHGTRAYNMMPNRSYGSCSSKKEKLGLTYKKSQSTRTIFSVDEDKIIKEKYPEIGTDCYVLLDNKSKEQVKSRAAFLKIKKDRKRKYKYVNFHKLSNKYHVAMLINGKIKSFGYYASEDEAGKVAMEMAKKHGKAV